MTDEKIIQNLYKKELHINFDKLQIIFTHSLKTCELTKL